MLSLCLVEFCKEFPVSLSIILRGEEKWPTLPGLPASTGGLPE